MDEQAFVDYLKRNFPFSSGTGIGDDAAVVAVKKGLQITTKDLLVEGIHFSLDYFSMAEAAGKSLAVNISDIAAMGGEPDYFFLGLGYPSSLGQKNLESFFEALKAGCQKWSVQLAGGDFSRSPHLFISITMVGRAEKPVFRSGAKPGHLIGITGPVGDSALGLKCLQAGIDEPYFIRKHKIVEPEITKGPSLARYASAMIDVSDGLVIDLKRLLSASETGGEIDLDRIPMSPRFQRVCESHRFHFQELALAGGEDYVLLFTVPPESEPCMRQENVDYRIIGRTTGNHPELKITLKGRPLNIDKAGYDHFNEV